MTAQALPAGMFFVVAQDGDGATLCGLHGPFFVDWGAMSEYHPDSLVWGPGAIGTLKDLGQAERR